MSKALYRCDRTGWYRFSLARFLTAGFVTAVCVRIWLLGTLARATASRPYTMNRRATGSRAYDAVRPQDVAHTYDSDKSLGVVAPRRRASRLWRFYTIAVLVTTLVAAGVPRGAEGAPLEGPLDFAVPNGRFFTQANGSGGGGNLGYRVTDEAGMGFWTAFQQLGGADVTGYPVSRRFAWNGFVVQAFQKLVLQWRPETKSVAFVNVFDEVNARGKDPWLRTVRSTPERAVLDETGKSWEQVVAGRLALLDANAAIKARYLGTRDYVSRYGLPTSRVGDMGNAYVIRFQRAVMQQWKVDVPWAKAGQVTVANGGDIGKEAGLYPKEAVEGEKASSDDADWSATSRQPGTIKVAIDPGHGGTEPGATHTFKDGSRLYEKDVNLKVAMKLGDELHRLGYNVIMTRRSDIKVNGGRDVDGDGKVILEDDLQARIDVANKAGADIFVAVHHNGIRSEDVRGTEVYYCDDRPFSASNKKLATLTDQAIVRTLREVGYNTLDRGAKTDARALGPGKHYYLLGPKSRLIVRPSEMPAIIGEAVFVSNDAEADLLRQDYFLSAIARGYVLAINRYFASEGR